MRKNSLLPVLCAVLWLAGCSSRNIRSTPETRPQAEHFIVLDSDVRGRLVLKDARLESLPNGYKKLVCTIHNPHDKSLYRPGFLANMLGAVASLFVRKTSAQEGPEWADVKVQWLDENGSVVDETNWQAVQFHRLMDTTLTYSSARPGVADFRVYMRTREHLR